MSSPLDPGKGDASSQEALAPARMSQRSAWIAGVFCLVVCGAMLWFWGRGKALDPLKSPQLIALKEELRLRPKDESLKAQIRTLDLELRRRYFRQIFLNTSGAWLVLASVCLFLAASKYALRLRQQLPLPRLGLDWSSKAPAVAVRSRWAVALAGMALVVCLVPLVFSITTPLPRDQRGLEQLLGARSGGKPVGDFASTQEMRENWPRFLGPRGTGWAAETNAPLTWSAQSGAGILWRSEIPRPGFNSPLVWGERVLLAGGDATSREVLCYDAKAGSLLWRQPVQVPAGGAPQEFEVPEHTGYAPSTMATDGRRVYAIFVTGELAAFTLEGQPVWARSLGRPKNPHGHAASLATFEDQLLVQLDQGETEHNISKLYAIDGRTGNVVWQRNRPVPASWATPLVVEAAGKTQIITLGVPWVIAYSARDGAELWRAEGLNNEVTSSPGFAGGLVLAISPYEKLMAIRPDGQGDVTSTHVVWAVEDNIPDVSSPASNGDLVFTVSSQGMLTCYDARDGQKHWEKDLEMECQASPTIVGDRLYVVASSGVTVVAAVDRQFGELARNELGERVLASPAFVRGRIYVRGLQHLFCLGAGEQWVQRN